MLPGQLSGLILSTPPDVDAGTTSREGRLKLGRQAPWLLTSNHWEATGMPEHGFHLVLGLKAFELKSYDCCS